MRSPFRFTFPFTRQLRDGAPLAEAGASSDDWAVIDTLSAPSMTVWRSRWRQSHGAMKAPDHIPRSAARAVSSSWTYAVE
jgi:hypothetical protein